MPMMVGTVIVPSPQEAGTGLLPIPGAALQQDLDLELGLARPFIGSRVSGSAQQLSC